LASGDQGTGLASARSGTGISWRGIGEWRWRARAWGTALAISRSGNRVSQSATSQRCDKGTAPASARPGIEIGHLTLGDWELTGSRLGNGIGLGLANWRARARGTGLASVRPWIGIASLALGEQPQPACDHGPELASSDMGMEIGQVATRGRRSGNRQRQRRNGDWGTGIGEQGSGTREQD
jgi:hypothetical protein